MIFVVVVVVFVLRATGSQRQDDAEVVARVDACFTDLATRRGLQLERLPAYEHPVIGRVPVAPRVAGELDGFTLALAVEADAARDGDTQTVLRLSPRAGAPAWPSADKPCKRPESIPAAARPAMERLCAASHRVQLRDGALIAEPKVETSVDLNGHTRRVETDAARLDAWLELALELARTL